MSLILFSFLQQYFKDMLRVKLVKGEIWSDTILFADIKQSHNKCTFTTRQMTDELCLLQPDLLLAQSCCWSIDGDTHSLPTSRAPPPLLSPLFEMETLLEAELSVWLQIPESKHIFKEEKWFPFFLSSYQSCLVPHFHVPTKNLFCPLTDYIPSFQHPFLRFNRNPVVLFQ